MKNDQYIHRGVVKISLLVPLKSPLQSHSQPCRGLPSLLASMPWGHHGTSQDPVFLPDSSSLCQPSIGREALHNWEVSGHDDLGIRQAIFTLPLVVHYKISSLIPSPVAGKVQGSLEIHKFSRQIQFSSFLDALSRGPPFQTLSIPSVQHLVHGNTYYPEPHMAPAAREHSLPGDDTQSTTHSPKIQRGQQKPRNRAKTR